MTDNVQVRLACAGPPGLDASIRGGRDSRAVWTEGNAVAVVGSAVWSSLPGMHQTLLAAGHVPFVDLALRKGGSQAVAVRAERPVDGCGHGTLSRRLECQAGGT